MTMMIVVPAICNFLLHICICFPSKINDDDDDDDDMLRIRVIRHYVTYLEYAYIFRLDNYLVW